MQIATYEATVERKPDEVILHMNLATAHKVARALESAGRPYSGEIEPVFTELAAELEMGTP